MIRYDVHIEFVSPILGTCNADPEIHRRFVASKAPDAPSMEEEVAALGADAVGERGTTVFARNRAGEPMLWDYQLKGHLKDACGACRRMDGSVSKAVTQYKSAIDTLVFVTPRNVVLHVPEGEVMRVNQRPLRADTAQGPRVALAASEQLPEGTYADFSVTTLQKQFGAALSKSGSKGAPFDRLLAEWLSYGQLRGIGQWRNGGWGQYHARATVADTGKVVFDNIG